MSAKDFKTGETVVFDNRLCMVKVKSGKKCLAIPMPLGWFHFEPVDWNNVQRGEKTEQQ